MHVQTLIKEKKSLEMTSEEIFLNKLDMLEQKAKKGEFVSEKAVKHWFSSLGSDKPLSFPHVDTFIKK